MVADIQEFDITAPLPAGTSVLEASAGTGKTWTIVALVTRIIAEQDVDIGELLIMTFTRIATAELRSRVREGISTLIITLTDLAEGAGSLRDADPLAFFHATGANKNVDQEAPLLSREVLLEKTDRLRRALVDFDAVTIATIHEFCSLALQGLGHDSSSVTLLENPGELQGEIIDDVYLKFFMQDGEPSLPYNEAKKLAKAAFDRPTVLIHPGRSHELDPEEYIRVDFVESVREEFARRKWDLGVKTYDDLLLDLAEVVDPPTGVDEMAEAARDALRSRWTHVLVDEFQDTDDIQWRIFQAVFHNHSVLTLIGDPKQAIYGFRGGDIHTYLSATRDARNKATLVHNYRADAELIDSLNGFFDGAQLGHEDITVGPVKAGKRAGSVKFNGGQQPRLRMRMINPQGFVLNRSKVPYADDVRKAIADDLVADIKILLAAGHQVRTGNGISDEWRRVEARDIAILCHGNADSLRYYSALLRAGVHAVINRGANVFTSDAAMDWITLLEAIERPRDTGLLKAAALTPFFGVTPQRLLEDAESVIDGVSTRLREYGHILLHGGAAALHERMKDDEEGLQIRVLRRIGGERRLTDLRHVAELLHAEFPGGNPAAMVAWLNGQRRDAAETEYARRLESDDSAVQIYTIHMAKGLEFPFVYVPSTATNSESVSSPYVAHVEEGRVLNVAPSADEGNRVKTAAAAQDRGENERKIYVALTRGVSQVTTYFTPTTGLDGRAWYRLLRRRGADFAHSATLGTMVEQLERDWGGVISLEVVEPREVPEQQEEMSKVTGSAREWTRRVDSSWRRSSYTSLSTGGEAFADAEFKETPDQLSATAQVTDEKSGEAPGHVSSPMTALPKGARFGSLVHAVLENIDFRSVTDEQIAATVREQLQEWPQELDPAVLADAVRAVITTPLMPALDLTLEDLDPAQRLNELEFELPLDGGQWASGTEHVTVRHIAPLLRAHLDPNDPLYRYADAIDTPGFEAQHLRGYLTGSIDLVFREGEKFYVADYKTNWLGPSQEPNTTATYGETHLEKAMEGSSYPLQALIYTAALHRYLTWRLPGYDPDRHIGGVLYLYVRGMAGGQTPVIDGHATGVFAWHPPSALITAISDLFDGKGEHQ